MPGVHVLMDASSADKQHQILFKLRERGHNPSTELRRGAFPIVVKNVPDDVGRAIVETILEVDSRAVPLVGGDDNTFIR